MSVQCHACIGGTNVGEDILSNYKLYIVGDIGPWRLHECAVPRLYWRYKCGGGHS